MFSHDRIQLRQTFFDVWEKCQNNQPLDPSEHQIAQVIEMHPEYHTVLSQPDNYLDKDYLPDQGVTNPFLHLSLHLGVKDQVSTNKPEGIRTVFDTLCQQLGDPHEAEHQMMHCLIDVLWQTQQQSGSPEEYIEKIKSLLI